MLGSWRGGRRAGVWVCMIGVMEYEVNLDIGVGVCVV
jgi:hypothetical protein